MSDITNPLVPAAPIAAIDEINEAPDLRAEDARARYDAKMNELDRRDRAGPHWIYRD